MRAYSTSAVLLAAGGAAFLILFALLHAYGGDGGQAATASLAPDPLQEQLRSLSKTVSELQGRVAIRESLGRAKPSDPAVPTRVEPVAAAAPETRPAQRDEAEQEQIQAQRRAQVDAWYGEQMSLLEGSFVTQGSDPVWEARSQDRILAALEEVQGQIDLVALSCGTAMCRLDARRGLSGAPIQVDQVLHGTLGWEGQSLAKVDESTGEITVYLMREGVDMPLAEEPRHPL